VCAVGATCQAMTNFKWCKEAERAFVIGANQDAVKLAVTTTSKTFGRPFVMAKLS
jgi:hypothetical protein